MGIPLISVIVPIYNVELYLDKCVRSIANQTYQNLEIILVDDGSQDRCPHICDMWAKQDARIKVIRKENGGLSSARNAGLEVCSGEYICFVDGDDWIDSEMVEILYKACREHGVPVTSCGRYVICGENITIDKCFSEEKVFAATEFVANMFIGKNCDSSACDKIYQKELWRDVKFPYGKIYEDVAILYKVILKAKHVAVVNRPLYNYIRHTGSITQTKFSEKLFSYPSNTRNMLNDIAQNYPSLYKHACWAHTKAIQMVLSKLSSADKGTYKRFIGEFVSLSKELSKYRNVWRTSEVFTQKDKILCEFFSKWYIVRPIYRAKKKVNKFIR